MMRCPNCSLYMSNHMESNFGDARLVYTCVCGYSTAQITSSATDRTDYVQPVTHLLVLHAKEEHENETYRT